MKLTIDCQAIQSKSSMNRGIGNYSLDVLNSILNSHINLEITLLLNGALSFESVTQLIQQHEQKSNVTTRIWFPLPETNWSDQNPRHREISESLYLEVLKSTNPDYYLLLSPFEGFDEDICWAAPRDTFSGVIFYDAIPAVYPDKYLTWNESKNWYFAVASKLREFNRVFAISKSSANDAIKYFGIQPENIEVISFGLPNHFFENSKVKVSKKYVLSILGEDERKNKTNLLMAWKVISNTHPDLILRIVYKQSLSARASNEKFIQENSLHQKVEFLDFVDEDTLLDLYRNSYFTIFPSFYEGLGLPVLESLALRKPCLVSNRSSLPELVNDEAMIFNPDSPDEIASKVLDFISNENQYLKALEASDDVLLDFKLENKERQISRMLEIKQANKLESVKSVPTGLYFYSILPPIPSGIASHLEYLLHALHSAIPLTLISEDYIIDHYLCKKCLHRIPVQDVGTHKRLRRSDYLQIHNIGNSEYHIWQIDLVKKYPGLVIMHDGYLSGLVWSKFRKEKNLLGFLNYAVQEASNLNFLDDSYLQEPHKLIVQEKLTSHFIESSTAVVVHTQGAKNLITDEYCGPDETAVKVIPLVSEGELPPYVLNERKNIVGVFGNIADSKMYREVIEAWKQSEVGKSGELILRFIGNDMTDDFEVLIRQSGTGVRIENLGFVSDEEYKKQLDEVRFAIQLRRSFRGETSGALIELFGRGVPVITNVDSWVEDYPEASQLKVSKEFNSNELVQKIDWLASNIGEVITDMSLIAARIESQSNSTRCVDELISFAIENNSAREFMPVVQLEKLITKFKAQINKKETINEVVIQCLRSFPNLFNKRRILVVLSDVQNQSDAQLVNALRELKNKIVDLTQIPIFVVHKLNTEGEFVCVVDRAIDRKVLGVLQNKNFIIRLRATDLLIKSERVLGADKNYESVIGLIQRELGDFLAE